jgi:predicted enzyme related to lactoylglutathione lyase
MMTNKVCHFEIGVRDKARARDFYSRLFAWKIENTLHAEMIRTGDTVSEETISGHINSLGHEPHNYTIFYVMVDDVAAAIEKAVSLGGKKIVGPVPLPNNTEFGWIADPEGNTIGVYAELKA